MKIWEYTQAFDCTNDNLNEYAKEGWKINIVTSCPVGKSGSIAEFKILYIFKKRVKK